MIRVQFPVMAEQCDDCGVFKRRIMTPDGEDWLCLNCATDPIFDALTETREALDLDPRTDTCAFAFGIANALAGTQVVSGRSPRVVAAACLYSGSIIAIEKIDQKDIAEAAGISASALRRSTNGTILYRELYEATDYPDTYPLESDPNDAVDLEGWRKHLRSTNKATSAKTAVSDVRRFAVWYDGEGDPEPGDVAAWLANQARQGYAPATIERRYESVQQYFEWADIGEIRENGA